jgi:exodeoxyribonuclease III
MKLATWNVNGIRNVHKKGLLAPFFEKEQPDIVGFQETKAEQHQSEVDLPDYEEYWNSSKNKKGYSGTAIFTKPSPLSVVFDFPEDLLAKYELADRYGDPNQEGRVITAEYEDFYFCTVYTPNAKDDLSRIPLRHQGWDPAFLEYMKLLDAEKPVIFCGDLNVAHTEDDLANPKPNMGKKGFTLEERSGIDVMVAAGFVDAFRLFNAGKGHYTWWSHFANARERNVGWRIDYFFVSEALVPLVTRVKIHPDVMGSDHCPVTLELNI